VHVHEEDEPIPSDPIVSMYANDEF
jgi:hypothetical protein